MGLENAVVVESSLFDNIVGEEKEAVIKYQMTMPFTTVKAAGDEDDVAVYGPVYVGDNSMLDRHKELVDAQAIINSWNSYSMNPVILYNHRKDYGVIGVMESVEMGEFETPEGKIIPAVMGRAVIDGGEKDIVRKIRKGMLRSFSIGFIAKAAVKECQDKDKDNCYMKFTEIEWIETSVVDIPASPNALFNVQKSILSYGDTKTSDCAEEVCSCSTGTKTATDIPTDEKHIIAVEERENSIVVEFAKHEMEMPEDEGQPEGESLYSLQQEITQLKETVATLMKSDRLNTHVDEPNNMTEELEVKSEEEVELPTEEEIPTESVEIKTEEVEELAEEELAEEEEVAEEAAEEELPEEVVEEVAEATEEEGVEEEVETKVLEEVVKSLVTVEATLSSLIDRLDETESLKTLLAEKDGVIATLTEEKTAAETEATIEAEVGKRLAEKMAEVGVAPSAPEANKKSLSPTPAPSPKSGTTKFDPSPVTPEGMTGLGTWLETRLGQRGA